MPKAEPRRPTGGYLADWTRRRACSALSHMGTMMPSAPTSSARAMTWYWVAGTRTMVTSSAAREVATSILMVSSLQPVCSMSMKRKSAPAPAASRPRPGEANSKAEVPMATSPSRSSFLTRLGRMRGSGHEGGDGNPGRGRGQWRDRRARGQDVDRRVGPAIGRFGIARRIAMDLDDPLHEIDDPVVRHAGASVEAGLLRAVEGEARYGDLHGEDGTRGMREAIVLAGARNDGRVRLGLRLFVERDRPLWTHFPAGAEGGLERARHTPHGGVVLRALGLRDDELPAQQLEAVPGAEHPEIDQTLVLHARPALALDGRHRARVAEGRGWVNVPAGIHRPACAGSPRRPADRPAR